MNLLAGRFRVGDQNSIMGIVGPLHEYRPVPLSVGQPAITTDSRPVSVVHSVCVTNGSIE
ncbi:hypothetical protein OIE43_19890 [Streptomyces pseudovenezuelae]|uniref:hypothetical protein n=1 Tax=Streptomyces pseudovenezuelae TaxID=67350 RepID=UPI000B02D4F7|nr:hypothetical protein [Streptomyces pseudovenezuelae]